MGRLSHAGWPVLWVFLTFVFCALMPPSKTDVLLRLKLVESVSVVDVRYGQRQGATRIYLLLSDSREALLHEQEWPKAEFDAIKKILEERKAYRIVGFDPGKSHQFVKRLFLQRREFVVVGLSAADAQVLRVSHGLNTLEAERSFYQKWVAGCALLALVLTPWTELLTACRRFARRSR